MSSITARLKLLRAKKWTIEELEANRQYFNDVRWPNGVYAFLAPLAAKNYPANLVTAYKADGRYYGEQSEYIFYLDPKKQRGIIRRWFYPHPKLHTRPLPDTWRGGPAIFVPARDIKSWQEGLNALERVHQSGQAENFVGTCPISIRYGSHISVHHSFTHINFGIVRHRTGGILYKVAKCHPHPDGNPDSPWLWTRQQWTFTYRQAEVAIRSLRMLLKELQRLLPNTMVQGEEDLIQIERDYNE